MHSIALITPCCVLSLKFQRYKQILNMALVRSARISGGLFKIHRYTEIQLT